MLFAYYRRIPCWDLAWGVAIVQGPLYGVFCLIFLALRKEKNEWGKEEEKKEKEKSEKKKKGKKTQELLDMLLKIPPVDNKSFIEDHLGDIKKLLTYSLEIHPGSLFNLRNSFVSEQR